MRVLYAALMGEDTIAVYDRGADGSLTLRKGGAVACA